MTFQLRSSTCIAYGLAMRLTKPVMMMVIAAGPLALLSACVAPVEVVGPGISQFVPVNPEFMTAAALEGERSYDPSAQAAVKAALVEHGLKFNPEARFRVDVGFAIAPIDVAIADSGSSAAEGSAERAIALCKRQRYVLSIAMLDRDAGRVLFRNRASATRCGDAAAEVLPILARAAVRGS